MAKARYYCRIGNNESILIGYYDFDTEERVQLISDEELEQIRNKITARIAEAASDIAMQNPTSPLFDFAK